MHPFSPPSSSVLDQILHALPKINRFIIIAYIDRVSVIIQCQNVSFPLNVTDCRHTLLILTLILSTSV
ncbi:hypothetical protein C5167_026067 [Papaver somniferum]|nr:hypothetical protein C5167_026067 [Papaver somniferum]